jgi:hypothetical protein
MRLSAGVVRRGADRQLAVRTRRLYLCFIHEPDNET